MERRRDVQQEIKKEGLWEKCRAQTVCSLLRSATAGTLELIEVTGLTGRAKHNLTGLLCASRECREINNSELES